MAGLYYDTLVCKEIKLEERDELYQYARYFDAPDSMLFRTGYDPKVETNPNYKTDTIRKAVTRATLDRNMNANPRERFIYLSKIPKKLLKNCAFQEDAKKFWQDNVFDKDGYLISQEYDEETLKWVLKYKNVENCI